MDNIQTQKLDETTMEVVKTIPEEIIPEKQEVKTYEISFLVEQKKRIYADYDNTVTRHASELAIRQAEKDEIDTLLAEADRLGIVDKVEPVEEEVIPE